MDTKICKAMYAHMKDKVIRFGKMPNRSHVLDAKKNNAYAPEQFKDKFNKKMNPTK